MIVQTHVCSDDHNTMKGTLSGLRNDHERRSSSRGPAETSQKQQSKGTGKERTFMDRWVEPTLAPAKASYEDHGAAPFGVLEHMQPLGEAPSTKLKQKVKGEGARKSILGRSAAALGADAGATPEGTPAPASASSIPDAPSATQAIVIDDEQDADYAPAMNGKSKERLARSRAAKRKSEPAATTTTTTTAKSLPSKGERKKASDARFEYDGEKLKRVVEAAKARAAEVGKPDLAAAVDEIYVQSQLDYKLRVLLEAILTQNATPYQNMEFQGYVRAAKKKLKDQKVKARQQPAQRTNGMQDNSAQAIQSKLTSDSSFQNRTETSTAHHSTEHLEPSKHKLSLKVKSPAKDPNRRRSGKDNMSGSPRKRAGSDASDSSLTSLTSNEDDGDMELDEPEQSETSSAQPTQANGIKGKDHAAERGSLAVPGGVLKRTSADADAEDDEREQQLAAKRQKLSEGVARDSEYPESSVRPSVSAPKTRALQRLKESAFGRPPPRLELGTSRGASTRGSRAVSTDVESPLSDLSPPGSRQSTPRLFKNAPKPTGKRAKTKQS